MEPRASAEFVESSVLEAVVPSDSVINIEDELNSWDGTREDDSDSLLPFLPQRQILLFGRCCAPDSQAASYSCTGI